MGLITETVKIKWNGKTRKHYEKLGYVFTGANKEFEVKTKHLTYGCRSDVECICDNCGKKMVWKFRDYSKQVKEDGKTYCKKCANILYSNENTRMTKLKNGISFEDWCINNNAEEALKKWDYELNNCKPNEVSYRTHNKFWFKCDNPLHKSELKNIRTITSGRNNRSLCSQCNSIAQYLIDCGLNIEDYLDSEKNVGIDYWAIPKFWNKKLWFKCPNDSSHGSYYKRVSDFTSGQMCPECAKNKNTSNLEDKTKEYLERLGYDVFTEYKCSLWPKNPKTNRYLPYDNEIILSNNSHLIIEVHGEQHYNTRYFQTINKCSDEEATKMLKQRKLYDRYKKAYAEHCGYEYLEIPYTAFDKNETYKQMIDDKIEEILHNTKAS